jgi:hypothetical protein
MFVRGRRSAANIAKAPRETRMCRTPLAGLIHAARNAREPIQRREAERERFGVTGQLHRPRIADDERAEARDEQRVLQRPRARIASVASV